MFQFRASFSIPHTQLLVTPFHSQVQKVHSPNLPKEKCIIEVVRVGVIIKIPKQNQIEEWRGRSLSSWYFGSSRQEELESDAFILYGSPLSGVLSTVLLRYQRGPY